jgi:predicted transcriptional regulator
MTSHEEKQLSELLSVLKQKVEAANQMVTALAAALLSKGVISADDLEAALVLAARIAERSAEESGIEESREEESSKEEWLDLLRKFEGPKQ